VNEILTALLIEMIETVFGEGMDGPQRVIDGNGESVVENIISAFVN
jgi:hypothetical protein